MTCRSPGKRETHLSRSQHCSVYHLAGERYPSSVLFHLSRHTIPFSSSSFLPLKVGILRCIVRAAALRHSSPTSTLSPAETRKGDQDRERESSTNSSVKEARNPRTFGWEVSFCTYLRLCLPTRHFLLPSLRHSRLTKHTARSPRGTRE